MTLQQALAANYEKIRCPVLGCTTEGTVRGVLHNHLVRVHLDPPPKVLCLCGADISVWHLQRHLRRWHAKEVLAALGAVFRS